MSNQSIKLKEGTLTHLQEYISAKIEARGFNDESLHERLLLLSEEVGELIHACRKISGMYTDKARMTEKNVGEEVADVINMIFAVSKKFDIDVEKKFLKKEARVDQRVYERSVKKIN